MQIESRSHRPTQSALSIRRRLDYKFVYLCTRNYRWIGVPDKCLGTASLSFFFDSNVVLQSTTCGYHTTCDRHRRALADWTETTINCGHKR